MMPSRRDHLSTARSTLFDAEASRTSASARRMVSGAAARDTASSRKTGRSFRRASTSPRNSSGPSTPTPTAAPTFCPIRSTSASCSFAVKVTGSRRAWSAPADSRRPPTSTRMDASTCCSPTTLHCRELARLEARSDERTGARARPTRAAERGPRAAGPLPHPRVRPTAPPCRGVSAGTHLRHYATSGA